LLNVAVVFLAPFVPLAVKLGAAAPLGSVVAVHEYVRAGSPPPSVSAPSTDSALVELVTVAGAAAAAVATVGAALVTVTLAVPFTLPLVAVTVALPGE
jgi:hypothetical protein